MVPAAYVKVDRLPLGANGKLDRGALPEPERAAEPHEATVEPRDDLERRLVAIWRDVLSVVSLSTRDSFFDLGGHSLLAVRMVARLEAEFGISLPLATLFEAPSIEGLAAFIRDTGRPAAGRSMIAIQPAGSRPPIFGLPGVEGGVLGYHALARLLGPDQPFYGLQSRGLDGLGQPLRRIEDIAAACIPEIREAFPQGPYHLVGMCMGGVVAWEMAQQLREAGQEVGLLALLETWPPEAASSRAHTLPTSAVLEFITGRLRLYSETLARLRGPERLRYLLGRLKPVWDVVRHRDPLRGVRAEFHRYAVARANLFAFHRYEPHPYPGPVVLFYAEGRTLINEADGRLRWRQLAGQLDEYRVPADDSGQLLREPQVREIGAQLTRCIQRVQTPAPARRA
jgi:thioesterase domain-containing protein/acyl carrier protein